MVRLTDRPEMTLDVYHGRKTTIQQQQQILNLKAAEMKIVEFANALDEVAHNEMSHLDLHCLQLPLSAFFWTSKVKLIFQFLNLDSFIKKGDICQRIKKGKY